MHWNLMQCVIMANTIWYYSLLLLFWDNLISRFLKRGKKLSRAVSRKGKWHPFLRDQLRRPSPTLSLLQLILSFNLFVIGPEYFNLAVHQIMANFVELSLYYEIVSWKVIRIMFQYWWIIIIDFIHNLKSYIHGQFKISFVILLYSHETTRFELTSTPIRSQCISPRKCTLVLYQ